MIPRLIHYSWISSDPQPELVKRCLESWVRVMPDYELVLWDAKRIADEIHSPFVDEAIREKKWAFAADYVRLYAVYHYGGIWLDADVEVRMSFDRFLSHRFFIGQEAATFYSFNTAFKDTHLTAHCFGAEAGHSFLRICLDYYQGRHFVTSTNEHLPQDMRLDMTLLPLILARLLQSYGYRAQAYYYDTEQTLDEDIHVYPSSYFDVPKSVLTKKVYCIHHCMESWGRGRQPRPRRYATWGQTLYWGIMRVVNWLPRKFGKEVCICFCRW